MNESMRRTPLWAMVAMVALLAAAIMLSAGVLDAGAKKKKKKKAVPVPAFVLTTQVVEQTAVLPNTGSCTENSASCTGSVTVTANCPAGFKLTGGGIRLGQPNDDFNEGSYPSGNGWTAVGWRGNNKTGNSTVTAVAVCAK